MKIEILLSCMHQKDASIIQRTHVQSDILIINQCDIDMESKFSFIDARGNQCESRMIYTSERGLSRSRNMAIREAKGDICLICDDDELLIDGYVDVIAKAFVKYPETDVITFALNYPPKIFPTVEKKVGYIRAMKTNSLQIAFRRRSIVENHISFDVTMGSGSGNGCGEEVRFLFDCLKKGLNIRYVPQVIASVKQEGSKWFDGYTNVYFLNKGYSNRKLLGLLGAWLYSIEYAIVKYKRYKCDNTFWNAVYYQLKGTLFQWKKKNNV